MRDEYPEHTLAFLLAFHKRVHWLDSGHWLKFDIERIDATPERPHGLRCSFTLHDPQGNRLVGFDNAHGVPERGSRFKARPEATDHWHRTPDDEGRPYVFKDAETLSLISSATWAAFLRRKGCLMRWCGLG